MELWPQLHPFLVAACQSNDVASTDLTPNDIYTLVVTEQCGIFCCAEDGEPRLVFVIQFTETNGRKGAEFVALAGRDLMKYRNLYWGYVLDWLRANGVVFIDIYASERMAKVYNRHFGFDRSCVMLRKVL